MKHPFRFALIVSASTLIAAGAHAAVLTPVAKNPPLTFSAEQTDDAQPISPEGNPFKPFSVQRAPGTYQPATPIKKGGTPGITATRLDPATPIRGLTPKLTQVVRNCRVDVMVTKHNDAITTWEVDVFYKTPNMASMHQGGNYWMTEGEVNNWAIRAANRVCYDSHHDFNDPCAETNLKIRGDLTGFGVMDCAPFAH